MHPVADQGPSSVPAFLTKLWTLVEDPTTNEFICWDATGKSFHVCDQGRFSKEVLPMYFKHSNIASFIRQLNMYGFRKVVGIESGGLKVEKDDMEFAHPYFQRDKENLLEYIKRKVPNMKADEMKVRHDDVHRVLSDVRQMKGKQDNMSGKLDQMKRENELLWLEVASLRQKHMKQQQIVNKLIQFLVSLVGNRGVDRKRKMPLMLNDVGQIAAKKGRPRSQYSIDSGDFQHEDTTPGQSLSIHEVTDQSEYADRRSVENLESELDASEVASPDLSHNEPWVLEGEVEPKDIMEVLTEQSEIMSVPTTTENVEISIPGLSHDTNAPTTVTLEDLPLTSADTSAPDDPTSSIDAVLSSTASPEGLETQVGNSVVPSKSVDSKILQRSNSHPMEMEMTEHLDGLQSDLESLKELLAGGQYTFEPGTLLNLFDLGSSFLPDQPSTSTGDSGFISGQEVVQYNPPEDITALFDLGDLSNSTPLDEDSAEAVLQEMVKGGQSSTLNTPQPLSMTTGPFEKVKRTAPTSTEEVD